MLVGNDGYIPYTPTMFFPGEGYSTAINKMPYSTETFATSSSTLTMSTYAIVGFTNGNSYGYAVQSTYASNKMSLTSETVSTLSTPSGSNISTYRGGITASAGYYMSNETSSYSTRVVNIWTFSTDTVTTSTALQSFSNFGPYSPYTFSNSPSIYFGGGQTSGTTSWGGLVKYNTSTNTGTSVWSDTTATARSLTAGAENGTTAGYLGGGYSTYGSFPTNILKIVYATDTSYSTLSATLSAARVPARVGVQANVCAYYAGGKSTAGSGAVSLTTVEKLTYSTETRSAVSTASVNRDGLTAWNNQ